MRALVIDDELLVLEGLEAFLQASLQDLTLDKTADVQVAVRLATSVRYEIVLLDWHLAGTGPAHIDGSAVVEALRRAGSTAPIIVISGDSAEDWPAKLIPMGLSGFVPKIAAGKVLLDAIEVALRGGIYLPDRKLLQRADAAYRPLPVPPPPVDPRERFPDLTERQCDVFRIMIRGLGDKQIARELKIAESTVKTHIRAILDVVGVNRRGEAVFKATERTSPHD